MKSIAMLVAGLVLVAPTGIYAADSAAAPRVSLEGGAIEGRADGPLWRFEGIRYAAPPIGELRWRAPRPVAPWSGTLPARTPGPACVQNPRASSDNGGGDVGAIGEDCLFLNVVTPGLAPEAKRPVMVWIHGGALVFGAGGTPVYDGAPLARRGAVFVSINYRLGALGFFAHPALASEGGDPNFGLLDQIAALRWVQQNIARFGGDPGNVTIFGQSAGAESVLALYASPLARGLFHKGIAQSPYGIPSHPLAKARITATRVASALKLDGANATAADLRAVPADAFARLDGPGLSLAPGFIVGAAALPRPILTTFQRGEEAPLPLVIGNTSDDGSVAIAFGVDPAALVKKLGAARVAVRALYPRTLSDAQLGRETARDVAFTAFARRIAYLHSSRAPTWRYYYGYVPEGMRTRQTGVPHGAEIPFTMGTLDGCDCLGAPVTAGDRAVAQRTSQRWFDLARSGTPVPDDADAWPRDDRRRAVLLEIADADAVRPDFMKRRLDVFIGALNVLGAFGR
ncbi:carboxylesterase/lipase family protein [Rhizobacter fulvus]